MLLNLSLLELIEKLQENSCQLIVLETSIIIPNLEVWSWKIFKVINNVVSILSHKMLIRVWLLLLVVLWQSTNQICPLKHLLVSPTNNAIIMLTGKELFVSLHAYNQQINQPNQSVKIPNRLSNLIRTCQKNNIISD